MKRAVRRLRRLCGQEESPRRSGTAATEFALVLPVLMGIALGCVDLGRGVHGSIALSNAVREGTIYGATTGFTDYTKSAWEAEIHNRVRQELADGGDFDLGKLDLSVATVTTSDDRVLVTVAGRYPFETIVDWPGLPRRIELQHRFCMQRFR